MAEQNTQSSLPEPLPTLSSGKVKGTKWLTLAIGSGAFASFNGLFAKLTTSAQTHSIASSVSQWLGLSPEDVFVEYIVRAIFFGLNVCSNAIMWILFTRALTAGTSSTRVSVLNTSANFVVTAFLGMFVFAEKLPLTWWLGASLLAAGTVIIGRRESEEQSQIVLESSEDNDNDDSPAAPKSDDDDNNDGDTDEGLSEHEQGHTRRNKGS